MLHLRQLLRPPHDCVASWAAPSLHPLVATAWYEEAREQVCAAHYPVALEALCVALCEARSATGSLDWTVREEVPFRGDQRHLMDFLQVLLEGVGQGPCRMALTSSGDGLTIELDGFTEKGWWRQAMSLFAGDAKAEHWSMIRMRCDRLGGRLDLDCDAAGARALTVSLPVYSA